MLPWSEEQNYLGCNLSRQKQFCVKCTECNTQTSVCDNFLGDKPTGLPVGDSQTEEEALEKWTGLVEDL